MYQPLFYWKPILLILHVYSADWLDLSNMNLTGAIPSEIGLLTSLSKFCCMVFCNFYYRIWGTSLLILCFYSAAELDLQFNSLMGAIPSEIGLLTSLSKLCWLWHGHCDFCSFIKRQAYPRTSFHSTANLHLNDNSLTGAIPSEISLLTSMGELCCCVVAVTPLLNAKLTRLLFVL